MRNTLETVVSERRKYITQATADELKRAGTAEWEPHGEARHAKTFNIVTMEWTHWHVVPDDDPRVGTFEIVKKG